jgi:hypothetical protein
MIDAAQAGFFIASKPERHPAVGAELIQQPDAALGIAKGQQFLAQQLYTHRRAVGFR